MNEQRKAWIGVDVGTVRVGIAVAERGSTFAMPHATAPAERAVEDVVELMVNLETENVVIGLPLELSGREGPAVRRVRGFVARLEDLVAKQNLELNLKLCDERLTTGLADRLLDDAGVRGKRRKKVVDQVAATQILQVFLDGLSRDGAEKES